MKSACSVDLLALRPWDPRAQSLKDQLLNKESYTIEWVSPCCVPLQRKTFCCVQRAQENNISSSSKRRAHSYSKYFITQPDFLEKGKKNRALSIPDHGCPVLGRAHFSLLMCRFGIFPKKKVQQLYSQDETYTPRGGCGPPPASIV